MVSCFFDRSLAFCVGLRVPASAPLEQFGCTGKPAWSLNSASFAQVHAEEAAPWISFPRPFRVHFPVGFATQAWY